MDGLTLKLRRESCDLSREHLSERSVQHRPSTAISLALTVALHLEPSATSTLPFEVIDPSIRPRNLAAESKVRSPLKLASEPRMVPYSCVLSAMYGFSFRE